MLTKSLIRILVGVCLLSSHLAHSAQPQESINFTLANHYDIGGEGRWDLLAFDAKRHRLFVSRSTHVQVIDADSGKVIGDIPGTEGVHGIALADDLNVGFTSNGKSNSVTVFDLTTLKVIETIKISGLNPDVILYEPRSKHIFAFNGHSANASVIDATSHKEITTISLPGKPELAVSNNAGKVFVNIEDKNEIAVIDSSSKKVLKSLSLGGGIEPTGLAIDKEHNRLFSVCANNKMEVLDSETGRVVSEVAIGSGPDSAAFDSKLGIAFSSNGDGTLTVVKENDPDHFSISQNVITQKGARTMAYDPDKHRAYLVTASFGETPPVTIEQPKPRPPIIPNSFVVLVVSLH
ncbi:MAG: cytochrome D1 domain-containing protein [Gallionellaceae bacterium]